MDFEGPEALPRNIDKAIAECESVVSKLPLNTMVKISCQLWDKNPQTKAARGYFTASGVDEVTNDGNKAVILPEIILLPERIYGGEAEIREIIKHEMVHAYDHCIRRRDLRVSDELACSEIRAAREAECAACGTNPFIRLSCAYVPMSGPICERLKKECVGEVAIKAMETVFPSQQEARESVKRMFSVCYRDLEIFSTTASVPVNKQD